MPKLEIRQGDWVVVCDGKKALVLENAGDEKFLNLRTREALDHPDARTSELGSDAPRRVESAPQLPLLAAATPSEVEAALAELDLDALTPLQALTRLYELKAKLRE